METFLEIVIAITIGGVILAAGLWGVRLLARPVPGEPDPDEIVEVHREFRCTVCGMRLTVTHAQDEEVRPPRHCREEMLEV